MVRDLKGTLAAWVAGGYLLLAGSALVLQTALPDDEFWGMAAYLLTYPWSIALTFFMWTLAHNSAMFLVPALLFVCALINAAILYSVTAVIRRSVVRK